MSSILDLKECDICGNQALRQCYIFGCEKHLCVAHATTVVEPDSEEVTYRCPEHA